MRWTILAVLMIGTCRTSCADDGVAIDPDEITQAIEKSLPLISKAAEGSAKQRTCFTCHNQALPILVLSEAQLHGFEVDEKLLGKQVQHTLRHLQKGKRNYSKGRGQGGQVLTAGYALWALEDAGHEPDETTTAVSHYLLEYQSKLERWSHGGKRPPSSGSDFTATYVALRGLARYATDEQAERHSARKEVVGKWLVGQTPNDTEGLVFQLRSLNVLGNDDGVTKLVQKLLDRQQKDGGWAQTPKMTSDAYATATVLVALMRDSDVTANHEVINKGIRYLLQSQKDDGSWHVKTRATPFQKYYESGFPHGKDQFISVTASSWATIALMLWEPAKEST